MEGALKKDWAYSSESCWVNANVVARMCKTHIHKEEECKSAVVHHWFLVQNEEVLQPDRGEDSWVKPCDGITRHQHGLQDRTLSCEWKGRTQSRGASQASPREPLWRWAARWWGLPPLGDGWQTPPFWQGLLEQSSVAVRKHPGDTSTHSSMCA